MNYILAKTISIFSQAISFMVLAHVILSYFLDHYHPVRVFVDRLVNPLLLPIRRIVPTIGMMDFSPMILIILLQVVSNMLISFLGY